MTTQKELDVLILVTDAWNTYCKLPVQHPDEQKEFHSAIHRLQDLIAIRVARRADPRTWACLDSSGKPIPIDPVEETEEERFDRIGAEFAPSDADDEELPKKSVSVRVGMPPAFPKPRLIVERSRGKGKGTALLAISRDVANALIQAGLPHEG